MQRVVCRLAALIERNHWQSRFAEAIRKARAYNIPSIRHVDNLDDFLRWMNGLLEWVPTENPDRHILDMIHEFYFFLGQPPVKDLQSRIIPRDHAEPSTELSQWIVDFVEELGDFFDRAESISPESVKTFYKASAFNMDEYMPPPSGYKTFNQLFARHVRPGMRPVAAPTDPSVITCAVDSTFLGWWQLNERSKITVKGLEWSVLELLEDSPYRDRFRGGVFTHGYLSAFDCHRLHVPVGGVVKESRLIHGQVYLDVKPVPAGEDGYGTRHDLRPVRVLVTQDDVGYQFSQMRGLIVLDTPIGLVAVLPIGMGLVSSVVMTAEVGKRLWKGEEFAYFQCGGSDHITLFEAACGVNITAQPNAHYNQGACIGYAHPS